MNQRQSIGPDEMDELLRLLADRQRRELLRYFRDSSENVATVTELAGNLRRHTDEEAEKIATRLHHVILPRLVQDNVVEYDVRSSTVRYQGRPELETLLDATAGI